MHGCVPADWQCVNSHPALSSCRSVALAGMLQNTLGPSTSSASLGSEMTSVSKAPFRKVLTKSRSYLETGNLSYDEAVVSYLMKLDEHRKKCEMEGRYDEAKAAAHRLADLKTAQVERIRSELVANQTRELEEVGCRRPQPHATHVICAAVLASITQHPPPAYSCARSG